MRACRTDDLDKVKETLNALKKEGKDVNTPESDGETGLHYAAKKKHLHIVQFLISEGANVDAKRNDGFSVIHTAVLHDNLDVCKYLVSQNCDVNVEWEEATPFDLATGLCHEDIVTLLEPIT